MKQVVLVLSLLSPVQGAINLQGVWESRPTQGGDVVEGVCITTGEANADSSVPVTTWGTYSDKNDFTLKDQTLTGPVTGEVSDNGKKITWSHGYTSTLIASNEVPSPIAGVWESKSASGGPVVEGLCITATESGIHTYGSVSQKNDFVLQGDKLVGPVTGTLETNPNGKLQITWSHGYVSTQISATSPPVTAAAEAAAAEAAAEAAAAEAKAAAEATEATAAAKEELQEAGHTEFPFSVESLESAFKANSETPFLEGEWLAKKSDGKDGPVETLSITQAPPATKNGASSLTTWGSISGRNEFKIKGGQIEGKVNGVVSDDAKTITWSHGYTAYLESPRPIDLEGVWQVYSVAEDGKSAQATEQCSVEQRKHDGKTSVHSFCEQSGYHEWMLDEEAKTMKNGEEKWAVSPCSGVVYSKEKGVFATKLGASSKAKATATKDPVSRLSKIGKAAAIGPAWVHGDMEKPEGEKDMGTWQALVYTPEQQERLGVDEFGVPTSTKDVDEMAKLPLLAPGLMIPKKTLRGGK